MYTKITISGKICTGKSTLFKDLQQQLGWPTFSAGQFFRDYVRKHGLSLEKAEEQNETITKQVDYGMQEKLKTEEHIILEGWMTGLMAVEIPQVLKILLTCDDRLRIKRFMKREKINEIEATTRIYDRETNLFNVLESIYHRNDFVNPKNYDLIIDTTSRSPQTVLQTVLEKLKN